MTGAAKESMPASSRPVASLVLAHLTCGAIEGVPTEVMHSLVMA